MRTYQVLTTEYLVPTELIPSDNHVDNVFKPSTVAYN